MDKTVVAGCIRQVVILYKNDCMGIGLGKLNYQGLFQKLKAASCRDIKEHFISYKNLQKDTSDLSNLYIHSIFTLFLIKQTSEINKLLKTASQSRMQFWPRVTPAYRGGHLSLLYLLNNWELG